MRWTTQDGRQIDVKDMETSHIKNAKSMLLENINRAEDVLACADPLKVDGMTIASTEKDVERWNEYVEAFNKELKSRLTNN